MAEKCAAWVLLMTSNRTCLVEFIEETLEIWRLYGMILKLRKKTKGCKIVETKKQQGNAVALLPIGVFLVIFLGAGLISGDFYAMPAIVAFLIALAVAFAQNKKLSFAEKLS